MATLENAVEESENSSCSKRDGQIRTQRHTNGDCGEYGRSIKSIRKYFLLEVWCANKDTMPQELWLWQHTATIISHSQGFQLAKPSGELSICQWFQLCRCTISREPIFKCASTTWIRVGESLTQSVSQWVRVCSEFVGCQDCRLHYLAHLVCQFLAYFYRLGQSRRTAGKA